MISKRSQKHSNKNAEWVATAKTEKSLFRGITGRRSSPFSLKKATVLRKPGGNDLSLLFCQNYLFVITLAVHVDKKQVHTRRSLIDNKLVLSFCQLLGLQQDSRSRNYIHLPVRREVQDKLTRAWVRINS